MSKKPVALVQSIGTYPKKSFLREIRATTRIFLSRCQIRFETRDSAEPRSSRLHNVAKTKRETRTVHHTKHLEAYNLFMLIRAIFASIVAKILSCHSQLLLFVYVHFVRDRAIRSVLVQFINVHFRTDVSRQYYETILSTDITKYL